MSPRHLLGRGLSVEELLCALVWTVDPTLDDRTSASRSSTSISIVRRCRESLGARGVVRRGKIDTLALCPRGQPDGEIMPASIAVDLMRLVPAKVAILDRQVRDLQLRGWSREELEAECLSAAVSKWRFPRSRWASARGDLGAWTYVVSRSRLLQLLARPALPPVTGAEEDVALQVRALDGGSCDLV